MARAYYFETLESLPEWKKQAALTSKQTIGHLEPPVIELLASFTYRTFGGEYLWNG
jgi:hypothetical protein